MRTTCLAVVLGLAACSSDSSGPDADIDAALVGEWVAEPACSPPCAFTLTWVENPLAKLNVVTFLAYTIRITVTGSGDFDLTGPGFEESGTVETRGSTMIVRGGGTSDTIDYEIDGAYLYLDFRREYSVVSFNPPDTVADPAHVTAVFRRRQ